MTAHNRFLVITGFAGGVILSLLLITSNNTTLFDLSHGDIKEPMPFSQQALLEEMNNRSSMMNQRRKVIQQKCKSWGNVRPSSPDKSRTYLNQIIVNDRLQVLACLTPKAGSSNLKRVLLYLSGVIDKEEMYTSTGYDIHYKLDKRLKRLGDYSAIERLRRIKRFRKFLFVRNPLERFVSGYSNKLHHINDHERGRFLEEMRSFYSKHTEFLHPGKIVNSTVSFLDWAQFTVDTVASGEGLDNHFAPSVDLCNPCFIKYDFIANFDTLKPDIDYIFKTLGIDVEYPTGSRKSEETFRFYINQIPVGLLKRLANVYKYDFGLFGFPYPDFGKK